MGRRKSNRRNGKINERIQSSEAVSSSSAAHPPPSPPWIDLPGDVTANILKRLGAEEILESAQKVCTTWWKVCKDPAMWRTVHLSNPRVDYDEKYEIMCRHSVDRSQGQLVELELENIGNVES